MVKKLRLMKKSYCQPNYFVRLKPLLTQISSASFFNDARHGWVGLGCCFRFFTSIAQRFDSALEIAPKVRLI